MIQLNDDFLPDNPLADCRWSAVHLHKKPSHAMYIQCLANLNRSMLNCKERERERERERAFKITVSTVQ